MPGYGVPFYLTKGARQIIMDYIFEKQVQPYLNKIQNEQNLDLEDFKQITESAQFKEWKARRDAATAPPAPPTAARAAPALDPRERNLMRQQIRPPAGRPASAPAPAPAPAAADSEEFDLDRIEARITSIQQSLADLDNVVRRGAAGGYDPAPIQRQRVALEQELVRLRDLQRLVLDNIGVRVQQARQVEDRRHREEEARAAAGLPPLEPQDDGIGREIYYYLHATKLQPYFSQLIIRSTFDKYSLIYRNSEKLLTGKQIKDIYNSQQFRRWVRERKGDKVFRALREGQEAEIYEAIRRLEHSRRISIEAPLQGVLEGANARLARQIQEQGRLRAAAAQAEAQRRAAQQREEQERAGLLAARAAQEQENARLARELQGQGAFNRARPAEAQRQLAQERAAQEQAGFLAAQAAQADEEAIAAALVGQGVELQGVGRGGVDRFIPAPARANGAAAAPPMPMPIVPAGPRGPPVAGTIDFATLITDPVQFIQNGILKPFYQFGMCPVCLLPIQEQALGEACVYHSHKCAPIQRNERLYRKYFNSAGNTGHCITCGRACQGHAHFELTSGDQRPGFSPPPRDRADFWDCRNSGGGGRRELIARLIGIIRAINNYGGVIQDNKAFYTRLTDAAEEAAMNPRWLGVADRILAIPTTSLLPLPVWPFSISRRAAAFDRIKVRSDLRFGDNIPRLTPEEANRLNAAFNAIEDPGIIRPVVSYLSPERGWKVVITEGAEGARNRALGAYAIVSRGAAWLCSGRGNPRVLQQINNNDAEDRPAAAAPVPQAQIRNVGAEACPVGHTAPETVPAREGIQCYICMLVGEARDNRPLYRLHHFRPTDDGHVDYTHSNDKLICANHLMTHIRTNYYRRFKDDCFIDKANGCGGKIHPCEIRRIFMEDLTNAENQIEEEFNRVVGIPRDLDDELEEIEAKPNSRNKDDDRAMIARERREYEAYLPEIRGMKERIEALPEGDERDRAARDALLILRTRIYRQYLRQFNDYNPPAPMGGKRKTRSKKTKRTKKQTRKH